MKHFKMKFLLQIHSSNFYCICKWKTKPTKQGTNKQANQADYDKASCYFVISALNSDATLAVTQWSTQSKSFPLSDHYVTTEKQSLMFFVLINFYVINTNHRKRHPIPLCWESVKSHGEQVHSSILSFLPSFLPSLLPSLILLDPTEFPILVCLNNLKVSMKFRRIILSWCCISLWWEIYGEKYNV